MKQSNHEPSNEDRAGWARTALTAFVAEVYRAKELSAMHRDDLEDAVTDLICDLLHFADQNGLSAEAIEARARWHYEAEISGVDF
jgi:hypothetical protein